MQRMLSASLVAVGLLVLTASAAPQGKQNGKVDSVTASANAERIVKDINWTETPSTLTKEATTKGKLIFYMHMLGNIAGNT